MDPSEDYHLLDAVGDEWLQRHVREALYEDLGDSGDITSLATVPEALHGRAELVAKASGMIAGTDWAVACGRMVEPPVNWEFQIGDGQRVKKGQVIAQVEGPMRGILVSERTALNGFGRLCGIATFAYHANELARGTEARVIDTRKTTPGWRLAEKYAVRMGGAANHRVGLFDEILIKENHIRAAGGVGDAVRQAQAWREGAGRRDDTPIEIEVTDLDELREALAQGPERILLDNFTPDRMREAVEMVGDRCELEASGGITLANIAEVAQTGVRRISLGAMTHSIVPLDISLLVRETYKR